MKCLWGNCKMEVNDIKEHLGKEHIGFKRALTFEPVCRWRNCRIEKETRSRMMSHIVSHLDLRIFKCCHCQKYFKRRCDLKSHQEGCKSEFEKIVEDLFDGLPFPPYPYR